MKITLKNAEHFVRKHDPDAAGVDQVSTEEITNYRAFVEGIAELGGHVLQAHDELHFTVPTEHMAEACALAEEYMDGLLETFRSVIADASMLKLHLDLASAWKRTPVAL